MEQHVARLLVIDEIGKVLQLLGGNGELLGHGVEHGGGALASVATELHDAQKEQRSLLSRYLSVECGADGCDGVLCVQVVGHLVSSPHVAIKIQVEVSVPDAEVMAQVADQHGFCPCLVYLFLLAKQSEQAKKTG